MGKTCVFAPLLLVYIFFLTACSSVQVSQDFDRAHIFSHQKTYNWSNELQLQQDGLQNKDELLAKRFTSSINNQLALQGFTLSPNPSYLVSYNYTISTKLESDPVTTGFSYGHGRYGRYGGVGINSGNYIRQYDLGTLHINIYNAATRNLLWRGTGTREMHVHATPDEISKRVYELVSAVLKQFPPVQ